MHDAARTFLVGNIDEVKYTHLDWRFLVVKEAVDSEPEGLRQHSLVLVLHVREVVQHPAGSGPAYGQGY